MFTSVDSLQQSLTVIQHQMSQASDQPLSLDVDSLREQIASHDVLVQYLTTHESDIKTAQSDLDVRGKESIGEFCNIMLL